MATVLMHGPALDGSGILKELEVESGNVGAFKASGYVLGGLPKAELPADCVEITDQVDGEIVTKKVKVKKAK